MSVWKGLLLRIGEASPDYGTSSDFKEHIETCFGVLRRELEHSAHDVLQFLVQCAEQLPHKIPLYSTVIGLLNLENEDFIRKVVEKTHNNFQDALDTGNCNKIRILMRFLTAMMCSKVLHPSSLVIVFETLLSSAATTVDEDKGNPSWQSRADFYITCILSCLPWGGAELIEQVPGEIERVMVGVEAYLSIRKHVSDTGLSFFEDDDDSAKVSADKDFLEDLWGRIQVLSSNGWKLDSVPRPHLSFEAQLVNGKSHEFGPISCPDQPELPSAVSNITYGKQKHDAESIYPQRIRRLNIFPSNKTEDMEPMDRFIVEEYLLDVLFFLNGCRKECASYMAGLPVPFRYEYLMAETIFSQLLLLPQPPFRPTYYTLVIMDLCKALPGAFPGVVAGAVRALFEKIADLDMECRTRLILWFSHHLSNFQFIWPWEEWSYVLDLSKWAPQRVFVQEVLEREVRLSYWEKVKQSIESAPGLEQLLPPKGTPNFKFSVEESMEGNEQHALSAELRNLVKGRASAREVILWIEESLFPVHGMEVTLSVVAQTLLDIGSKSFTHLITVLERYGQVIAKLCADQDKQVMLITEIDSYWKNNAQMTALAIDRMMGYRLLSNLAIVRWVFSPENVEQFHLSDRSWEILRNAVGKTYNRVCAEPQESEASSGIRVSGMQFAYDAQPPLFYDFSLNVAPGSRCLLVGANGSGKTTLLKILAGKQMVGGRDVVRVLNCSAFHDTHLVCSGDLAYLGGSWSKTVGSAGEVPLQGDFSAEHMIFGVEGTDPVRREKLIELLDIDLKWRMHKVSDGQRRRVQICMGLLHPFKVLLLDEVTVDLDVVARMDLLEFFKEECEQRGATIVYATHIFDGLETWATHLAYIQDGELKKAQKLLEVEELKNSVNLLSVVESWLRAETKQEKKKTKNPAQTSSPFGMSSRQMAYYR